MGNVLLFARDEDIVSRQNPAVIQALGLMKEALATLDRGGAGCTTFACHLSMAIDLADDRPIPMSEEECQTMLEQLASPCPGRTAGSL